MILGETEYTGFQKANVQIEKDAKGKEVTRLVPTGEWVSANEVDFDGGLAFTDDKAHLPLAVVRLSEEQVTKQGDSFVLKGQPEIKVDARAFKMSKSRGNVINPDTVVQQYGADSLRLYEMFMGPLEAMKPWNMQLGGRGLSIPQPGMAIDSG